MKRKRQPRKAAATKATKRKRPRTGVRGLVILSRRRPTFPHSCPCSIIGPARLNFRVRDGNGCDPRGMTTRKLETRERIPELIPSKGSRVRQQKLAGITSPTSGRTTLCGKGGNAFSALSHGNPHRVPPKTV